MSDSSSSRGEITDILVSAAEAGRISKRDADRLFSVAYDELHGIAEREMAREKQGHTLQPTAIIGEIYLRLIDQSRIQWENRAHFFGIAARAMRQVLIDYDRRKRAQKRGGGWERVMLGEELAAAPNAGVDPLDLARALSKLSEQSERIARVVELRVFAGLKGEEIGAVLGVSRKTVTKDWRFALMWLRAELAAGEAP